MRYFLGIFIGILLAAAGYLALFASSLGITGSTEPIMISEWYRHKQQVADQLPSPRIIIVSGSNGLYGIQASRIEKATGIPTVNFATHAGLATEYILERSRKALRPGDTVILPLEYELYLPRGVNPVFSEYVLAEDVKKFKRMPVKDQLIWAASAPFKTTVDRLKISPSDYRKKLEKARAKAASELNDRGDITIHSKSGQTESQKQRIDSLKSSPHLYTGDWNIGSEQWKHIREYVDWCHTNRIRVLATFPNTIYYEEYEDGALGNVTRFLTEKYRSLGVPVLGEPRTFLYEPDYFFDTNYHLTREGAEIRTDKLLALLHPYLEKIRSQAPDGR